MEERMSFKHKKKFGQNFLTDQKEVLRKIMEVSAVNENDTVLEIGPGEGALTALLLDTAEKVVTVEIDRDLEKILRKKFDGNPKYTLVMNDVLETDLKEYVGAGTKVVANIPYYITSPIINKLIENRDVIDEIYIMVQKEVAERICAKKGKERSVLTLAVEYFGEAEYLFTIPKEAFTPIPKVDSAFMSIKLYKDDKYKKLVAEDIFFKYVKAAFANKRKNLLNNFTSLGMSKDELRVVLNEVGIKETERAENLTIEDFINLIAVFEKK
jgi:16S rRNA (adenine1518-N6/adenine1519-N6)-dimethyltransferase